MSITDELREWTEAVKVKDIVLTTCPAQHIVHGIYEQLLAIADHIDAEHKRLMQEQPYTIDMVPMTDERMAEHGWVRLPVDADGVPIRVGDVMDYMGKMTVDAIDGHNVFFFADNWADGVYCEHASELRHHHAPTVEDVMVEFATDWESAQDGEDKTAVLKEYAKRLTLAEGEDA